MDEGSARLVPEDLDQAVAVEVVGRVFDLDEVLVLQELLGVTGLDGLRPGRLDPLEEQVGRHGRPAVDGAALAGDERHRHGGQGRVDLLELLEGLSVVGTAEIAGQEGLGTVGDRAVEPVLAPAVLPEEDDVEPGRKAEIGLALVEPHLGVVGRGLAFEPLDVVRLAQDDIEPAAVGLAARTGRVPAEIAVGVAEAPEMLGLELVLRGPRRRIALLPEGLDEEVPLPVGLELQEDLPLRRSDDGGDLVLEPALIAFRQLGLGVRLAAQGLRPGGQEEKGRDERCGRSLGAHGRDHRVLSRVSSSPVAALRIWWRKTGPSVPSGMRWTTDRTSSP